MPLLPLDTPERMRPSVRLKLSAVGCGAREGLADFGRGFWWPDVSQQAMSDSMLRSPIGFRELVRAMLSSKHCSYNLSVGVTQMHGSPGGAYDSVRMWLRRPVRGLCSLRSL